MKEKFWPLIENLSANLFQKWIQWVHRNILRKRNSDKALLFQQFWTLNRKNLAFCQTFLAQLLKLQSTCPYEHFEEKKIWKNWFFVNFGHWATSFDLLPKFFVDVVKNAIYVCASVGEGELLKDLHFSL